MGSVQSITHKGKLSSHMWLGQKESVVEMEANLTGFDALVESERKCEVFNTTRKA